MKILLVCAAGMSTSLVAEKMKKALGPDEQDWVIMAKEATEFENAVKEFDVVLLGPQVRFRKDEFSEIAQKYGVPVEVINTLDYGMCRGDAILNAAKEAFKKNTN